MAVMNTMYDFIHCISDIRMMTMSPTCHQINFVIIISLVRIVLPPSFWKNWFASRQKSKNNKILEIFQKKFFVKIAPKIMFWEIFSENFAEKVNDLRKGSK